MTPLPRIHLSHGNELTTPLRRHQQSMIATWAEHNTATFEHLNNVEPKSKVNGTTVTYSTTNGGSSNITYSPRKPIKAG
jgi:hypothetical protein